MYVWYLLCKEYQCGSQVFNDYAIVKSNNNNTSVSLENLYFTDQIGRESEGKFYHKIDCEHLMDNATQSIYEADQSSEFKYDDKKINTKINGALNNVTNQIDETIICFYDDSSNTYYEANPIGTIPAGEEDNVEYYSVGALISNPSTYNYNGTNINLYERSTGKGIKYLYDHRNEGCYDCIIGGNYDPIVKYYKDDLYRTYITEAGEVLVYYKDGKFYYEDGTIYDGSRHGIDTNATVGNLKISETELNKRRKSVYTYMAKIRNNLYKTNAHVNR